MDRSIHRLKLLYDGQEWNLKTHKDVQAESGRDLSAGIGCKIIFLKGYSRQGAPSPSLRRHRSRRHIHPTVLT
jgi:hypothetical protein